jgi:cob(I)alamin adenosyltransferase
LFSLGGVLANPGQSSEMAGLPLVDQPFQAGELEEMIDAMEAYLPPLTNFILPGGCAAAATLHLARAACRRTERRAVALAGSEPVPGSVLVYLNRLSDMLFTAARAANAAAGIADIVWTDAKGEE